MDWTKEKEIALINKIQDDYVEQLKDKILSEATDDKVLKEISFTSPTGTGKTNMMAKLINAIPDAYFIVTTLSKGQLYKQIRDNIAKDVAGSNYVVYGSQSYTSASILKAEDILSGIPSDKKVYWLRDEGHIRTNNWSAILSDKCDKIINFSATNETEGITCNFTNTMMLRTVNQTTGDIDDALKKLKEVKAQHSKIIGYNPCAIFRVVSDEAEAEIEECCDKFRYKYISLVDNNDFDMSDLCEDNNKYDVIINKQKVVEGIDIRRAHVLWMENKPSNPATTIQVIGRCRRNALLWRDDIDILAPENKVLLKNTRQCYVFYKTEKMKVDTDENGELAIAFCPYISVERLKAGYTIHVDDGMLPNGLIIRELQGCTGDYFIKTDEETGFNIVDNENFYPSKKCFEYSDNATAFYEADSNSIKNIVVNESELYPYVWCCRELSLIGSDVYKPVSREDGVIWTEDKTVTTHLNRDCKFNRLIERKFSKELTDASSQLFSGKNDFGFSKKLNSCVGFCAEYYAKYLVFGSEHLGDYLVEASKQFYKEGYDVAENRNNVVVRACFLKYKDVMREVYGINVSRRVTGPSINDLIKNAKGFNSKVIELGMKAAKFIQANIKSVIASHMDCSFKTFSIIGLADIMDDETIIDIKCTNHISREMVKQVLSYYYLSTYRYDINIKRVIVYDAVSDRSVVINLPEIKKDDKDEIVSEVARIIQKYPKNILSYNEINSGVKYKFSPSWDVKEIFETDDYLYLRKKFNKGWSVRVKDTTKTSYGEILSEIAGKPVTSMSYTFSKCIFLTTVPLIPNSITSLFYTFSNCNSLKVAPTIPNSIKNMRGTFCSCKSLTTAPVIPDSVTDMTYTFFGCASLTGTIEINATPDEYRDCFLYTTQHIILTGKCYQSKLKDISTSSYSWDEGFNRQITIKS